MRSIDSLRCPNAYGNLPIHVLSAIHLRVHLVPNKLGYILKTTMPRHTVHIDHIGKLNGKSNRKEYVSVIIDAFIKYTLFEYTLLLDTSYRIQTALLRK